MDTETFRRDGERQRAWLETWKQPHMQEGLITLMDGILRAQPAENTSEQLAAFGARQAGRQDVVSWIRLMMEPYIERNGLPPSWGELVPEEPETKPKAS